MSLEYSNKPLLIEYFEFLKLYFQNYSIHISRTHCRTQLFTNQCELLKLEVKPSCYMWFCKLIQSYYFLILAYEVFLHIL